MGHYIAPQEKITEFCWHGYPQTGKLRCAYSVAGNRKTMGLGFFFFIFYFLKGTSINTEPWIKSDQKWLINQAGDHLQVFKGFTAQRDKISVKICVLQLSFQKLLLFERFDRDDAKVAGRVFLASLSIVLFQVPRNIHMFIVIIYMQYIK